MRLAHIIVATIALAITTPVTPVVAEVNWENYSIVQDKETKRCKVVDTKPTPDDVASLVDESRALAEAAKNEGFRYELLDCSINR